MDKTLLKGLSVLEELALSSGSGATTTIQQMADRLGMTKSNIHRVLQTLAHAGYAQRDEQTGSYVCTMKLVKLGSHLLDSIDLRRIAAGTMRKLAEATGEAVHLSILEGAEVVYIDTINSQQAVRAFTAVGARFPANCVATGKALLAFQTNDPLDRIGPALVARTPKSITDVSALRVELDRIRRAGYALTRGEGHEAIGGIGAPIFDGFGKVVAGIGVSGPLERFKPPRIRELSPMVVDAAAAITRSLG